MNQNDNKKLVILMLIAGLLAFSSGFFIGVSFIDDLGIQILTTYCAESKEKCDNICLELRCQQEFNCWTSGNQPPDTNIMEMMP